MDYSAQIREASAYLRARVARMPQIGLVLGSGCVTNMDAGVLPQKLSHQEVVETADRVRGTFTKLLDLVLTVA